MSTGVNTGCNVGENTGSSGSIPAPAFNGYYDCTFESLTAGELATNCQNQTCTAAALGDNLDGPAYSYGTKGSSTQCLVNTTGVWSGSKNAEIFMDVGDVGIGFGFDIVDVSMPNGKEVWYKLDVKLPVGFDTSLPEVGKTKFMRIGMGTGNFDLMMMSDNTGQWRVQNSEVIGDTAWNAAWPGDSSSGLGPGMTFGNSYSIEAYLKADDTAGIIRCWQDGVLFFEDESTPTTTSPTAQTLTTFSLIGNWNAGVNSTQSFFVDNIKITTDPNGTGGAVDVAGNKMIGGENTGSGGSILDENFESYNVDDVVWESGGDTLVSDDRAYSGTKCLKPIVHNVAYETGGYCCFGGKLDLPIELTQGDELWIRWRQFLPTGFLWSSGDGSDGTGTVLKTVRVHTKTSVGTHIGYNDFYVMKDGTSIDDPASSDTLVFLAQYEGDYSQGGPFGGNPWYAGGMYFGRQEQGYGWNRNAWNTYEMYFKFGTKASGIGRHRIYQNGDLIFNGNYEDENIWGSLATSTDLVDFVYLYNYWNGGAPTTQSFYIDDVRLAVSYG